MMPQIPQYQWEASMRKYRELRAELDAKPTQNLQGMVETYKKMQPFTSIKYFFGSDDLDRLRMGRLILTKRELSELTEEELRAESEPVSALKNFMQSLGDFVGYN
ncbi:hypothetical protein GOV11_03890, partial [Candidatus Woesearchaeota archaeon]|nr:hypothetical protein [Candidatus Woesearchaeota archaeon]